MTFYEFEIKKLCILETYTYYILERFNLIKLL